MNLLVGGGEVWCMNKAMMDLICESECRSFVELVNHVYLLRIVKMVVKEIVSRLLEEEEVSHFGKEWFEQDINKEEERFEGDEDGGEV
ncbi:hypothetical protein Tco_0690286 [Tanacetum coccineum]